MKIIRTISNSVNKFEKLLVMILIPVMLFVMVLDIFFRYFLQSPLIWAQELTLYTFVWSSFIGASLSIKSKEVVAVTLLVDKVSTKWRGFLIVMGLLISSVFCMFIFYLSINWISNPTILLQKSVTTGIPMIYMYLCIPISLLFMSLHFIHWFLDALQLSRTGKVIE